MAETASGEKPSGDINDVIANSLLGYVEAAMGRAGLEQLVERLPGATNVAELVRGSRWWPAHEFAQLVTVATAVTGDTELGRRVGEQSLRIVLGGPMADMMRSAGTVEAACAVMADYSTRMAKGRVLTVVESSSDHVVIEGRFFDGNEPNVFACDFSAGYFASLPTLFEQLGTCVETTCQNRGDDLCRYRVAWRPDPSRTDAPVADTGLATRGASALEELEGTHRLAARLVESHQIDEALERVVNSVSGALGAPQYFLAVRLEDGAGRRVHQVGFERDGAEVLADMLDAGEELGDNCLIAEVKHADRVFGHLVAVFLPETKSTPFDRRLLRSYANFAGAAIQIVEAVDTARRDRDAATAMLGLATALAETSGVESVIESLCTALPTATGCDVGTVWLPDAETGEMVLVAATDQNGYSIPIEDPGARFDPRSLPGSGQPLSGPVVLDLDHPDHRASFGGGDDYPFVESALVPIGPVDNLMAVAGAIFQRHLSPAEHRDIGPRLHGLASQALVAFENARLIEATRHQALHDDLTGLPKRALAEDRCRQALARRQRTGEEVALLFVDVDDFKVVNDSFGHAVGDDLLKAVAERLAGTLRASDTCARVGGDEFVVILTGAAGSTSGSEVAERLTRSLDDAFVVGEHSITVTASIGIAWAGPGVETFDDLVDRADAAMYQAKAQGKARLVESS